MFTRRLFCALPSLNALTRRSVTAAMAAALVSTITPAQAQDNVLNL